MSKGTILVTGGCGYIGSHTIVDLYEFGYDVISVDNGINSNLNTLNQVKDIIGVKVKNYNIDLCDFDAVKQLFENENINGVIHFAALKAVGESTEKPFLYFRNNNQSLLNILEAMDIYNVENLIYSSSCTVYGNASENPVNELTTWQEAESPYGRTKQMGEQMIQDCTNLKGGKAILLRYFNPAGAHTSGLLGESPIVKALNLVPAITETASGKRDSLTVFGNDYPTRDGSCVRDYIHVMDLARAHTLAVDRLLNGKQEKAVDTFNLGIGEGVTVLEAIKAFEKVSGGKLNYHIGARRPGDVVAIYADASKANELLNWKPEFSIEDIMDTAWRWEQNKPK